MNLVIQLSSHDPPESNLTKFFRADFAVEIALKDIPDLNNSVRKSRIELKEAEYGEEFVCSQKIVHFLK